MRDLNDHARDGTLPEDPTETAQPVSPGAKEVAADAARLKTYKQILKGAHERATTPRQKEDKVTAGHWEIDRDTGGFRPGCVCIFGAKSHWGKSSSLVMFADENVKRGKRVLIVSAEDPESLYGDRLLVRRARVSRYRFSEGLLNAEEKNRITEVVSRSEDIPVFLDAIGKSVEWCAKRVKKIVAEEGISLVAWDYLHAFQKDKNISETRQSLNYIARVMTDTVKTANVAGLIYGQVTPDTKALIPDMYEIRDSKDVVNAAEVVMIGFKPATRVDRDVNGQKTTIADEGDRCVVVAKNKPGPGPAGRVYRMGSDEKHGCFDVVDDPTPNNNHWADDLMEPMGRKHWNGDN